MASQLAEKPDAQALVTAREIASPEAIAEVVAVLLSPAARRINGAVIVADNAAHLRAGQGCAARRSR